jgi:hypothetical protein
MNAHEIFFKAISDKNIDAAELQRISYIYILFYSVLYITAK